MSIFSAAPITDTVQTGDNAYEKIFGKPIFDHLAEQPEKARIFDDAMTGIHGRETGAILDAYDVAGIMPAPAQSVPDQPLCVH
jgi:hypothetical protein